jgi:hypothetical protein
MPMEIDAPAAWPRRHWLQGALLWAAWGGTPARAGATAARPGPRFVAAWDGADGEHHLGLLGAHDGALHVVAAIALPTRAHGLLIEPGGSVLAAARRPGDWVLRWSPTRAAAQWFWSGPERRHTGHLLRDPAGRWLYSAETHLETGQGLVTVRDARSFALHAEWATHGTDPHQLILDADGTLLVANGGVTTRPETGRTKLDLARMDSSLVRLDSRSGALLGQWRLADSRLSIRHLARAPGAVSGPVGIALQAEHDDPQIQAAAPVLALFDGDRLRPVDTPQPLAGYGGDIVATTAGFIVSAPRAGGVARWTGEGQWAGFTPVAEACSLSADRSGNVWVGGRNAVARAPAGSPAAPWARHALRLDNHWAVWPPG